MLNSISFFKIINFYYTIPNICTMKRMMAVSTTSHHMVNIILYFKINENVFKKFYYIL